jgi:hypothetical protein
MKINGTNNGIWNFPAYIIKIDVYTMGQASLTALMVVL